MRWFTEPSEKGSNFISWLQVYYNAIDRFPEDDSLFFAVDFGLLNIVEPLLRQDRRKANVTFKGGMTPLQVAAANGNVDIISRLISLGADVHTKDFDRGSTPLHLAAENSHPLAVKKLLVAGASPHSTSSSGSTPLYRGARGGSVEVLKLLYEAGSDVNARTWESWTPIFEAAGNRHSAATAYLIEWGADLRIRDIGGKSALDVARVWARNTVTEKLLRKAVGIPLSDHGDPELSDHSHVSVESLGYVILFCLYSRY